jgi:hypothetical protein
MTTAIAPVKKRNLPEWHVDSRNRKRGTHGGRWNMQRCAELIIGGTMRWWTIDELSRAMYGNVLRANRANVRKHIPAQRRYMMYSLEKPIVTQFGERGRIERIKLYDWTNEVDQSLLHIELDRARDRKELTEKRYNDLVKLFLLTDQSQVTQISTDIPAPAAGSAPSA